MNDASLRAAGPETEAAEGIEAVMATKYLKATLVVVLILVLMPITIGLMNFATPRQRAWMLWWFAAAAVGAFWVRALVALFRDERLRSEPYRRRAVILLACSSVVGALSLYLFFAFLFGWPGLMR